MKPLELLDRWRPLLVYDSNERFFADSASSMVENSFDQGPSADYATRLMSHDRVPIKSADDGLTLEFLKDSEYANGRKVHDRDFLDPGQEAVADARRLHPEHANVIYGRTCRRRDEDGQENGWWLQYWFFYFASTKGARGIHSASGIFGIGHHEGDWEMVQFGIKEGSEIPDVATFATHDKGIKVDWGDVLIEEETNAPMVFVALDSHASYPRQGKWAATVDDWCDAGGRETVRPAVIPVDETDPAWMSWPGHWGSTWQPIKYFGRSPQGPIFHTSWTNPDGFHSGAAPWREKWKSDGKRFGVAESATEAEDITVFSESNPPPRIIVDVPSEYEGQWDGASLVVWSNSSGDGPPIAQEIPVELRPAKKTGKQMKENTDG